MSTNKAPCGHPAAVDGECERRFINGGMPCDSALRATTPVQWRSVVEYGYPTRARYGNYPTVYAVIQARDNLDTRKVVLAEVRFIGGNESRPFWAAGPGTSSSGMPCAIENDVWHVTHWAPLLEMPETAGQTPTLT